MEKKIEFFEQSNRRCILLFLILAQLSLGTKTDKTGLRTDNVFKVNPQSFKTLQVPDRLSACEELEPSPEILLNRILQQ